MTAIAQDQQQTGRMQVHAVRGGGGLRLHVREWGKADGPPILFIHGWSQNHLCWAKQYESALADEFRLVAYDLRGHGMSEAPLEPEHYTDSTLWADDVAEIIAELGLDRPVLVGWSYGSFVICDYLRAHGQDQIAAINFVEGAVKLGEGAFGTLIGPGFLDHFVDATADDLPTNIRAMRSFVRACVVKAGAGRRTRVDRVLERCRTGADPRQTRCPHDRRRRCAASCRGTAARHPGPRGLGGSASDGRARPGHLPDRRGVVVRRRRSRAAPRGGRALQPRTGAADASCPSLEARDTCRDFGRGSALPRLSRMDGLRRHEGPSRARFNNEVESESIVSSRRCVWRRIPRSGLTGLVVMPDDVRPASVPRDRAESTEIGSSRSRGMPCRQQPGSDEMTRPVRVIGVKALPPRARAVALSGPRRAGWLRRACAGCV